MKLHQRLAASVLKQYAILPIHNPMREIQQTDHEPREKPLRRMIQLVVAAVFDLPILLLPHEIKRGSGKKKYGRKKEEENEKLIIM